MTRLALLIFFAACSTTKAESLPRNTSASSEVPRVDNVVLVTIDTLRADVLSLYGGRVPVPTMEKLAKEGWAFERCTSASMLTNPSHASILTSLYPRDHGVYDNESGINDGVSTLATQLRKQGKRTMGLVNFPHLNPETANLAQGFDRFVRSTRQERSGDEMAKLALSEIDAVAPNQSFFMWLHMTDPHAPYEPPHDVEVPQMSTKTPMQKVVRSSPGFQKNNPYFKKAFSAFASAEDLVARYYAEVHAVDRALGRVVDGLRERGRLANTAIVVTSDHGENLGERDLYFHHGGLYATTTHVPLIVFVPGVKSARIADVVSSVDIAPTVLELVRAPRWEPMRGDSLVAVARGERPGREVAFSEHMLGQLVSARSKNASLIVHERSSAQFPSYRFEVGRSEFYDLAKDPAELRPLDAKGPLAEGLRMQLSRFVGKSNVNTGKRAEHADRESLRALGYIE